MLKDVDNLSWEELRGEFKEEYVVLERQVRILKFDISQF